MAVPDDGEEIKLIISKVEKQPRRFDGIRSATSYESQLVPSYDSRQRKFTKDLNIYYDAVVACVRNAESILIFEPGEAKGQLEKRLERDRLGGHIVSIEMIDKMTNREIAAKVRKYFKER